MDVRLHASDCQRAIRCFAAFILLSTILGIAVFAGRLGAGDSVTDAVRSNSLMQMRSLFRLGGIDSWSAMWSARLELSKPASDTISTSGNFYDRILNKNECKFQYPPSSLLMLDIFPWPKVDRYRCPADYGLQDSLLPHEWPGRIWLDVALKLCMAATLALTVLIVFNIFNLLKSRPDAPSESISTSQKWVLGALIVLSGLIYYPLERGLWLGQVQLIVGCLIALAMWLLLHDRRLGAGVAIGVCLLIKPQLAILIVWAALRRDWKMFSGILIVLLAGTTVSILKYGTQILYDYVSFLSHIGQVGEVFWANQSLNGVLNRWIDPGHSALWSWSFPAYSNLVYWPSFAMGGVMTLVSLWPGFSIGPRDSNSSTDHADRHLDTVVGFGAVIIASTIASPIAWEHHYGSLFTVFCVTLVLSMAFIKCRAYLAILGLASIMVGNAIPRPDLVAKSRLGELAMSHIFCGGVLLFILVIVLRSTIRSARRYDVKSASA